MHEVEELTIVVKIGAMSIELVSKEGHVLRDITPSAFAQKVLELGDWICDPAELDQKGTDEDESDFTVKFSDPPGVNIVSRKEPADDAERDIILADGPARSDDPILSEFLNEEIKG